MLTDGLYDVPPGKVATVVTVLEMRAAAPLRGHAAPDGVTLRRIVHPEPEVYRRLFAHVGADWLWFSRLILPDDALGEILNDPNVAIYAVDHNGTPEGLLELDFRQDDACELGFFGLGAALIGTGAGSWLMDQAITLAWAQKISRFHVHTCTLDHPGALGFYMRSGFTPIRRQVEIADDPRCTGILPSASAPHIPMIG